MKRYLVLSLLISSAILFSSCLSIALKQVRNDIELQVEAIQKAAYQGEFSGLEDLIQDHQRKGKNLNVVLTHGMRRKESSHFDQLIQELTLELGFVQLGKPSTLVSSHTSTGSLLEEGSILKKEFIDYSRQCSLSFYFIHWSPITAAAKDTLFYSDYSPYRTRIASFVKENYFTEIFADKSLYLGPTKFKIQNLFFDALKNIPKEQPLVFVGGSLGSQIFYDFLYERVSTDPQVNQALERLKNDIEGQGLLTHQEVDELFENYSFERVFGKQYGLAESPRPLLEVDSVWYTYRLNQVKQLVDEGFVGKPQEVVAADTCSKILNSCFIDIGEETQLAINFLTHIQKVYLLSNQLPFFNLLEVAPGNSRNFHSVTEFFYRKLDTLESKTVVDREKTPRNHFFF